MKKVILFLSFGLLIGTYASAQAPKLGYINSTELLSQMPEARKADSSVQLYAKSFQDQLQTMSKEFEKKYQDYQAQEKTMTDAVKEVKEKELRDLQARIESTNQSAQEKIQTKKEELLRPVLEKADKAIKDVAKEKAYDYIFDAASILYAKDGDNILPLVKAKLGVK